MTRSIMKPFEKFSKEGNTVGRLLAGYSNIEISLFHAVSVVTGDFDAALRRMFGTQASPNASLSPRDLAYRNISGLIWRMISRRRYVLCAGT